MAVIKPTNRERAIIARLSPDEIAALDFFRAMNGPTWKRKLQVFWESGGLENETNGDALQRVRNTIGPSGLYGVRGAVLSLASDNGGSL